MIAHSRSIDLVQAVSPEPRYRFGNYTIATLAHTIATLARTSPTRERGSGWCPSLAHRAGRKLAKRNDGIRASHVDAMVGSAIELTP